MRFGDLLAIVGGDPVFETGLLLAGEVSPGYLRRQLSGWVNSGRLWQLRRGLYALAPPHQKVKPHPFLVANRLVPASYVSLQSALGYYGLIPEYVPVITSVTTRRTGEWSTPLGEYLYRHIQSSLFTGYQLVEVSPMQSAFVAAPEKALVDLLYFEGGADIRGYLESLRLQNLERLDLELLSRLAIETGAPRLEPTGDLVAGLARIDAEYEAL